MSTEDEIELPHLPKQESAYLPLLIAFVAALPAIVVQLANIDIASHLLAAGIYGLAIVSAAFTMSWAAEVAELDISRGLAIAVLAFIAVLPEYAVDFVFAKHGGHDFAKFGGLCKSPTSKSVSSCSLALANMTGGNRMLIGIGWSLVVFVAYAAWKRRGEHRPGIELPRSHSVEISFLMLASVYSLTLPFRHSITLYDTAVLVGIFVLYTIRIAKADAEAPELVGPAAWVGTFPVAKRRTMVILMFLFAGFAILLCADPFAESLVATGLDLKIDQFFLVQWVAPLATEAPELLVAGLFAWRLRANNGLSTLVSSKVNQWTLLVGTLPIAFTIGAGKLHGLPILDTQREELFLTAAQTIFAIAVLINLTLSRKEASALLTLFLAQFALGAAPQFLSGVGIHINADHFLEEERLIVATIYMIVATILFIRQRKQLMHVMRDGLFTPLAQLND